MIKFIINGLISELTDSLRQVFWARFRSGFILYQAKLEVMPVLSQDWPWEPS